MKNRLLLLTCLYSICLGAYALAPSDTERPPSTTDSTTEAAPALAVQPSDTAVELRNNSQSAVYVVQKGVKQEVPPKGTYIVSDTTTYPVSVTPTSGEPAIKFVTIVRKNGTCQSPICLVVQ